MMYPKPETIILWLYLDTFYTQPVAYWIKPQFLSRTRTSHSHPTLLPTHSLFPFLLQGNRTLTPCLQQTRLRFLFSHFSTSRCAYSWHPKSPSICGSLQHRDWVSSFSLVPLSPVWKDETWRPGVGGGCASLPSPPAPGLLLGPSGTDFTPGESQHS